MKKILFILTLIIGLMSFSNSAKASHVVGGDTQFIQTGPNTYKIIFRFFRYCSGIATPATLTNVRLLVNGTNALQTTVTATKDSSVVLTFGDECYTPTGLCVEVYTYTGTATIPNNPNGYYSTYTTGARNPGLTNLVSGNSTWYSEIPNPALAGGN